MSNGTGIPKKSSRRGAGTASSMTHPSGEIYLPSGVNSLEDWCRLLVPDSLAPPSVSQDLGVVQMISETSGLKRSELSVRFDPQSSSWRTSQESLLPPENGEPPATGQLWLENLPKRGMLSDGKLSELTTLAHPIDARGGAALGSWPTPDATPRGRRQGANRGFGADLNDAVYTWPPPVADDTGNRMKKYAQGGTPLSMATGTWPTPTATERSGINPDTGTGAGLSKEAKNWPTPDATNIGDGKPYEELKAKLERRRERTKKAVAEGRVLPGSGRSENLAMAVQRSNWMTPNTFDSLMPKSQEALDHEYTHRKGRSNPNNLRDQVAVQQGDRNWPTPTEDDSSNVNPKPNRRPGLVSRVNETIQNWPTPTANEDAAGLPTGKMQKMLGNHPKLRDVTGTTQSGLQDQTILRDGLQSSTSDQTSPQPSPRTLSPLFVEWLMGLPVGWTDLKPLAMESYQAFLQNFSQE